MGWDGRFNSDFFSRLDQTARAFSSKRWKKESAELFRLGQMIAKFNREYYWAEQLEDSCKKLNYQRVRNDLPTRNK